MFAIIYFIIKGQNKTYCIQLVCGLLKIQADEEMARAAVNAEERMSEGRCSGEESQKSPKRRYLLLSCAIRRDAHGFVGIIQIMLVEVFGQSLVY